MTTATDPRSPAPSGPRRAARLAAAGRAVPGLLAAAAVAAVASAVGTAWPVVGAPVIAVVVGAVLSPLARPRIGRLGAGLDVAKGFVLPLAVVLLGAQLSLREVAGVGLSSLPVMLGTLATCVAAAWWLGRRLGVGRDLRTLIGVGTGICGASAIAAVSPAIRARNPDIAYAITTIFVFNVAAVLVFPPIGHALGMDQQAFGLFAGTAVNDTSSVVAAASAYGTAAAQHAVVVKLVRTLMIIPVVLGLGAVTRRRERVAAGPSDAGGSRTATLRAVVGLVPWFLVGFVVVAACNSFGLVPAAAHGPVQQAAVLCIAVAMAGIGLSTDVTALRRTGPRPLALGLVLWVVVAGTSLGLQALTG